MGLAKQLYKNALWYWSGGGALQEEPAASTLGEDDWEVLSGETSSSSEVAEEEFKVTPHHVPLGLYSIISERVLNDFVMQNRNTLACFWSDAKDKTFHGSIKMFKTTSFPPGWFKLNYLEKVVTNFYSKLGQILYPELARLRAAELADPYSRRSELQSPLLQGLMLNRSFLIHLFTDICVNPYTELIITFPMEIVYDQEGPIHEWRESVDAIISLIADRPAVFPPLILHLIGPRHSELKTEAAKQRLREQVTACGHEYSKWIRIVYFQI